MRLAASGGITLQPTSQELIYLAIGLVVLFGFIVASRLASRFTGDQLVKRHVRTELVVISRRVVTVIVIGLGLFAAMSFAVESANVALFGLILATIVAALGVQDLLRDYVSGYYILLERHIRVGDRVTLDAHKGTIVEVRLRVTMLKSDDGNMIVVPNSELFTKPVTIHTSQPNDAKSAPPT